MIAEHVRKWYDRLPADRVGERAFYGLPEYSLSDPTGTTVGKVWRRNLDPCGDPEHAVWLICEYVAHPDPKLVGIEYRRPEIVK